jgi:hypothetical protein
VVGLTCCSAGADFVETDTLRSGDAIVEEELDSFVCTELGELTKLVGLETSSLTWNFGDSFLLWASGKEVFALA